MPSTAYPHRGISLQFLIRKVSDRTGSKEESSHLQSIMQVSNRPGSEEISLHFLYDWQLLDGTGSKGKFHHILSMRQVSYWTESEWKLRSSNLLNWRQMKQEVRGNLCTSCLNENCYKKQEKITPLFCLWDRHHKAIQRGKWGKILNFLSPKRYEMEQEVTENFSTSCL